MSTPAPWASRYMGLPYAELGRTLEGIDCWGLVRLVLLQEAGIETGDYDNAYSDVGDREVIPLVIKNAVETEWVKVDVPQVFDMIVLTVARKPMHVGVVVSADSFLHSPEGKMLSIIERFTDRAWERRIEGFYRHVSLAGSAPD